MILDYPVSFSGVKSICFKAFLSGLYMEASFSSIVFTFFIL